MTKDNEREVELTDLEVTDSDSEAVKGGAGLQVGGGLNPVSANFPQMVINQPSPLRRVPGQNVKLDTGIKNR